MRALQILADPTGRRDGFFDKEAHAAAFAARLPESRAMTLTGTFAHESTTEDRDGAIRLEAVRSGTIAVLSRKTMGAAAYDAFRESPEWVAIQEAGPSGIRIALTGKYRVGPGTRWREGTPTGRQVARVFDAATLARAPG